MIRRTDGMKSPQGELTNSWKTTARHGNAIISTETVEMKKAVSQ